MTATDETRHRGESNIKRISRKRWVPFAAAATAAALTVGAIASAGGGAAGAATLPQAQSAGNFLDATLGGNPIDQVAALKFARAVSPGTQSVQNPLDATVLSQINLPLTGALQFPKLAGADVGVLNQVAVAHQDGSSFGAAGAVSNSGGVSIGGTNTAAPDVASIDLCASALSGAACGSGAADALGELKLAIGAVSAVASTPKGYAKTGSTEYNIAGVNLDLTSPLLASVLQPITTTLTGLLGSLTGALGALLPATCTLTPDLNFVGGAIDIDGTTGSISVSVDKLLTALGLNLNTLPANTDLVNKIITYLTSADGLANAIGTLVNGLLAPIEAAIDNCVPAGLPAPVQTIVTGLITPVVSLLQSTIGGVLGALGGNDVSSLLSPLTDLLSSVVQIGVNVQPLVNSGDFNSKLDNLPKQGMTPPAVPYSTVVRAIEVNLLPSGGNDGLLTLALANAAAGPSTAPTVVPTTSAPAPPSTSVPPTTVPTGVPAGMGTHGGGTPVLTWILLMLGLTFAGGGVAAYRMRGRLNQH
jgi:hypothetical protein